MKSKLASLVMVTVLGAGALVASPGQAPAPPAEQSQAQPEQGQQQQRQPDPARQAHMLTKRLKLNPDQENQVRGILNDRAQQLQTIRSDNSLSAKDRHARMQALRQDTDGKIGAVLTSDQKQAYEQMQQQARERARQHHQGRQDQGAGSGAVN